MVAGGYHIWSQSGHTFSSSDKGDKEFNGWAYQAEGTYWKNYFGWYGYAGKDLPVKEEMYTDKYYKADVTYFGTGLKIRKEFADWFTAYIGGGINYTTLVNRYKRSNGSSWAKGETLEGFGPDALIGFQFKHSSGFYACPNLRYSWNRENSKTFNKTTFDAGGLRTWLGIGYVF